MITIHKFCYVMNRDTYIQTRNEHFAFLMVSCAYCLWNKLSYLCYPVVKFLQLYAFFGGVLICLIFVNG